MKKAIIVPPIKSQGKKTWLVPILQSILEGQTCARWVEPFMGSGVVGLNTPFDKLFFADTNPHIIQFYKDIQSGVLASNCGI